MQSNPQNRTPRPNVKEAASKSPVPDKPYIGIVTDCMRLNVREGPDEDAKVVAIIDCLSQVTVDLDGSTDDFCKVHTPDGIEGFCMKKYIHLRR